MDNSLLRQVVTAKNEDGVIATVRDYYDRYIVPTNPKYAERVFSKHSLVLCPFHDDNDPSLGLIRDKHDKDVEVFHCFGCGAGGDVVRMHRRFEFIQNKKNITLEQATKEVANLYGIELDEEKHTNAVRTMLAEKERRILNGVGRYDFRSHSANLLKLRQHQDTMSIDDFAKNLDVVLNMWKESVIQKDGVDKL